MRANEKALLSTLLFVWTAEIRKISDRSTTWTKTRSGKLSSTALASLKPDEISRRYSRCTKQTYGHCMLNSSAFESPLPKPTQEKEMTTTDDNGE